VKSGAEVRLFSAIVFKRLNRNGRGTHRGDLRIGPARYGELEIDAFALTRTASSQDDSEKPDTKKVIVLHLFLLRDEMV
jgi:hypothetical protein